MNIETILSNIENYEFSKISRCRNNPHSTMIGLWSSWWLDTCKDGHIRDGAPGVKIGKKNKFADLMFLDEKKEEWGVIEVEVTNTKAFELDVRNLNYYGKSREYKKLRFIMLHIFANVDKNSNYLYKMKSTQRAIKSIQKIQEISLNQSIYWIVILSKWNNEDGYIGYEWLVFRNGKKLNKFSYKRKKEKIIKYYKK